MPESRDALFSYISQHPCPKRNSFGHYESRAADLDCGDSEVGERCFVRFGLEVALRGPHVLPIYARAASGTGVDSPVSRCSNAIEQRCVPEFEWGCACGRARSDVADRAAETASGTGRAGMQLLPVSTQRSDSLQRSMLFVNLCLYVFWGRNEKTYSNTSRIAGHNHRGFSVCLYVILNLYVFCVH